VKSITRSCAFVVACLLSLLLVPHSSPPQRQPLLPHASFTPAAPAHETPRECNGLPEPEPRLGGVVKDIAEIASLVKGMPTTRPDGVRPLELTERGFAIAASGRASANAPEELTALAEVSARWGGQQPVEGGVALRYQGGVRVSWHGRELNARPEFGDNRSGRLQSGAAVFEGIDDGVDSVVLALQDRMEEFLVLERGAQGNTAFDYAVELPGWVKRIRQTDGGWVEFWDDQRDSMERSQAASCSTQRPGRGRRPARWR